ncbi:unnamed protein product [Rotaria sp. Silwood1]|nr:unnamed protein product [Rotaria sp. Silwood1]
MHTVPTYLSDLFATKFRSDIRKDEHLYHDPFNDELIRLQLDTSHVTKTGSALAVNRGLPRFTIKKTGEPIRSRYPKYCVVPSTITNGEIREAAKFRSYKQFPTIVWRHINGAIIAGAGQPEVSWSPRRSKEDENMIQAIINSCNDKVTTNSIESEKNSNRIFIVHAGSDDPAIKNYAKHYRDCDLEFKNLPGINVVSRSGRMLCAINSTKCENWFSKLISTHWLQNLSALIEAACCVVTNIDEDNRSVLVHGSNSEYQTSQIITLAKIMLDPYY